MLRINICLKNCKFVLLMESVEEEVNELSSDVQRPQLSFADVIDNSDGPFVHKLKRKPNAIVPLEDSYQEHPYEMEIQNFAYTPDQLKLVDQSYDFIVHNLIKIISDMRYSPMESTPLQIIDEAKQLENLCKILQQTTEFALDLEVSNPSTIS
jgi:exosome complex exonuclease RRP6